MNNPIQYIVTLFLLIVVVWGCQDPIYSPKKRAYPKIDFPNRDSMVQFDASYCNFTFKLPSYFETIQDTLFFDERPDHDCWFDLHVEQFDCNIHCNYVEIGPQKSFDEAVNETFDLANWHNKRA